MVLPAEEYPENEYQSALEKDLGLRRFTAARWTPFLCSKRMLTAANTIIAALALAGSILQIVFFFRERLRRNFHYSLQV